MQPFFTSRAEWELAAGESEQAYVRNAIGYLCRASSLVLIMFAGPMGAADSYWRSLPVLLVLVLSVCGALMLGTLLFRREWRAARRAYGVPLDA